MARTSTFTQEEKLARIFDAILNTGNAAASHAEIATLSGLPVTDIGPCLSHLRKNCAHFGWTIPHAKVGRALGRPNFFITPVKNDGTIDLDPTTPDNLIALLSGLRSTIAHIAQRSANEAKALLAFVQFMAPRSTTAAKTRSFARTLDYVAAQAEELLPQLEEVMNGTTGPYAV